MFESLKESFVGAFGMLGGHNAMEGKGISRQTQKWSSKLFDNAVEKVLKAKSDKFPFEQIVYLNSMEQQAEDAVGLIDEEIDKIKSSVSIENLEYLSQTVKEKTKDSDVDRSKEETKAEREEQFRSKLIDPDADPSDSDKIVRSTKTDLSDLQGRLALNLKDKESNLEEKAPADVKLARGDQFSQKRGDASRSRKNQGRNQSLVGNPGENEDKDSLTGENLKNHKRMDAVEGKGAKKRFDFPVPKKVTSDTDSLNVSGQVKDSQSDSNRGVVHLFTINTKELFFYKSSKMKTGTSDRLNRYMLKMDEQLAEGYIQIESHTDTSDPENYESNRELTMRQSVALITKCLNTFHKLSPSSFAAVAWGASISRNPKKRKLGEGRASVGEDNRIVVNLIRSE